MTTSSQQLLWQSVDANSANAIALMNFAVNSTYVFNLSPQTTSFQSNPLVARAAVITINGPYQYVTVKFDAQTFIYTGQTVIAIPNLDSFGICTITLAASEPPTASIAFYDSLQPSFLDGVVKAQNAIQINAIQSTVFSGQVYNRATVNSVLQTIVLPAANVNGVRIDLCSVFSQTGETERIMAKQSAPTALWDTAALTLCASIAGGAGTFAATYPLQVSAGYGIYEQSNDAVAVSVALINYKIL